jgi:hypothetical protein
MQLTFSNYLALSYNKILLRFFFGCNTQRIVEINARNCSSELFWEMIHAIYTAQYEYSSNSICYDLQDIENQSITSSTLHIIDR